MLETILLALGVLASLAILVYKYLTWHFKYWKKVGLPGPKPKILYGNFPSIITGKQLVLYDTEQIYTQYKKQHRAIGVFVTRNPEILLLDPQLGHEMLVANFRKYRDNLACLWVFDDKSDKYAARNPFFTAGDLWKTRRADAMGGHTLSKLNAAYPIWKSCAKKLQKYLFEKTVDGNAVVEAKDLCLRFTIDVMSDYLWGLDSCVFENREEPNLIYENAKAMLVQAFEPISLYYKLSLVPFLRRFYKTRIFPVMTDVFFSVLTTEAAKVRQEDDENADRMDFLNYILQLQEKKKLSHDDVMGSILTSLLDGYETTGNAIYHTLFYLAKYPAVQDKLRAEIVANVEGSGFIDFETLNSLPYLDQCVHETIRIITPVPILSRICTEPTELEYEPDKSIPVKVGTIVTIPIFAYHHDPDYFPNPYEYKPERFDNAEHVEMIKKGMFKPFGDGPRVCLGMRTGLLTAKTCLVQILKDFNIKCCERTMHEKQPDANTFILGLSGAIWLQFERIQK